MALSFTGSDLYAMRSEVRSRAGAWSTEIACYTAIGKIICKTLNTPSTPNDIREKYNNWYDVIRFRQTYLLPGATYMKLDDFTKPYGVPERTYDLNTVFAQCCLMYPEFDSWFAEESRKAQIQKEIRKQNAETNKTLMNLDNEYKSLRVFVYDLRKAIDNKACINYGSAKLTVYAWAPGTLRKYRTGTKLYSLDSRKTPLTAEILKAAADTILESCGEGW